MNCAQREGQEVSGLQSRVRLESYLEGHSGLLGCEKLEPVKSGEGHWPALSPTWHPLPTKRLFLNDERWPLQYVL